MDFDQIMREITAGLTGDSEKDIQYLKEQAEKYKDHELSREILRACGRLLYQCVPEDRKSELDRIIGNDRTSYESVLEEVRFKQHEKKYDEALSILEPVIRKFEEADMFTDDQVSEYHCFNEFFEEALYRMNIKPSRELRHATFPLDRIYMQYGSLLIDLRRLEEAETALATAMRWNPADVSIAFEYAETFKQRGDMESFFHLTVSSFRYAFRPEQVARCLRNMGYYFIEKSMWEEAYACYRVSITYSQDARQAMSELYYIEQKAGKPVSMPDEETLNKISEKYGFPFGPDEEILGLSFAYGKHFAEEGETDGARYCWQITYDLTKDDEIKKLLDDLPDEE